ncbi:hypothetical protein JR316_0002990 [Psilocybe cubensis]|uniref:Uncharacterized protein n=2 Tax=Psilocybe cubensis TaxID=181762 RepID=A0ACB8H794_PSICU|nr:hypothetical protein JR316_0002990 [Psilocybe cubensis]KAH9483522.1 hypothetical protein JR316_0002990 [Psilocybe cubensis]
MSAIIPQRQKSTRDAAMLKLSSQIDALTKERNDLHLQIDKIDEKLSNIRAEFGAIYNEPSPLLNLPAEITCLIFDYATITPPGYGSNYLFSSRVQEDQREPETTTELVLSHVCRRWREVALSYPRLWARFMYREDENILGDELDLQRFETYLSRSGTQSLELLLDFNDNDFNPGRPNTTTSDNRARVLDMALSHVARWRVVTIRVDFDFRVLNRLRHLTEQEVPKLEYFAFCPYPSMSRAHGTGDIEERFNLADRATALQSTIFTGGAPKLNYVHLGGYGKILPPLSNITTLRLEAEDFAEYVLSWPAMRQIMDIPTLTNLSIVGNVFDPPAMEHDLPLITMNVLEHLRYENDAMTLLLPYLRLPALQSLVLRNVWLPEELGQTVPVPVPKPGTGYFFPSLTTLTLIDSTTSTVLAGRFFAHLTKRAKTVLLSIEEPEENILIPLYSYLPKECWPELSTLILNLSTDDDVQLIIELATKGPNRRGKKVQVWLCDVLEKTWREDYRARFARLEEACTIKTLSETPSSTLEADEQCVWDMLSPVWPPASGERVYPGYTNNDDPFEIDLHSFTQF